MGKKGKRSKRGQAKKVDTDQLVIDNIFNRVEEIFKRAWKSCSKSLNSDAISTLKEALQFIEAKEAIIAKAEKETDLQMVYLQLIMQTYDKIIGIEHNHRCNYEEVIQMYNCFASKVNITAALKIVTSISFSCDTSDMKGIMNFIMMYHNLALIRLGNVICPDSAIFQDTTNYMKKADRVNATRCKEQIVSCLRATKNFDAAIDMERSFASIRNLDEVEKFESTVSLAITYMERYQVEFHKHTKKENEQEFGRITQSLVPTMLRQNLLIRSWEDLSYNDDTELQLSQAIALAQWYYLFSNTIKREDNTWTVLHRKAIYYVGMFIADKWRMKDDCFYCNQAPTKDEVKYVCGDCRVACYCSIDHQRASWKKNALHDMCFGHEAICPAMKAYRKWQEAVDSGDIEKEKKMKRRLGRECLGFLAYGLGLEDKWYDSYDIEEESG